MKQFKLTKGRIVLLVIVIAIVFIVGLRACAGNKPAVAWPSDGLATMIPEPPGKVVDVNMDDEQLDADIEGCTSQEFDAYIDACGEAGFTIDAEHDGGSFVAFSEEGYKLDITSFSSGEEFSITLDVPMELSDITWPTIGAGSLVPAPSSLSGLISSDSSNFFFAYIGNMDRDAFKSYVADCSEAGFTVDYDNGDNYYSAGNSKGASLRVEYCGFNTISVSVDVPEEDSEGSTEEPEKAAESEGASSDVSDSSGNQEVVSADFKSTMDSYEAFFNEYASFMESYSNSQSTAETLAEYADMMARYSEMMEKLDAIDEDSLSAADYAYYIEVQSRINARLAEVSS